MASGVTSQEEQQQQEHEIRDMISALAHHLTSLANPSAAASSAGENNGVKIITLAGENRGATMKSQHCEATDTSGVMYTDKKTMSAIMNSNYQAVNNSIMLKGRCIAEDAGVHVIVSDHDLDDGHVKEVRGRRGSKV